LFGTAPNESEEAMSLHVTNAALDRDLALCERGDTSDWKELLSRDSDGLEVLLLWSSSTDRVKVTVVDSKLELDFELHVAGADALDAFHHPFAFAAAEGMTFGVASRESRDLQPQS
jgi:hypothetical protein